MLRMVASRGRSVIGQMQAHGFFIVKGRDSRREKPMVFRIEHQATKPVNTLIVYVFGYDFKRLTVDLNAQCSTDFYILSQSREMVQKYSYEAHGTYYFPFWRAGRSFDMADGISD
jgi:hypothetical protein